VLKPGTLYPEYAVVPVRVRAQAAAGEERAEGGKDTNTAGAGEELHGLMMDGERGGVALGMCGKAPSETYSGRHDGITDTSNPS